MEYQLRGGMPDHPCGKVLASGEEEGCTGKYTQRMSGGEFHAQSHSRDEDIRFSKEDPTYGDAGGFRG